jgi:hypothetical protein
MLDPSPSKKVEGNSKGGRFSLSRIGIVPGEVLCEATFQVLLVTQSAMVRGERRTASEASPVFLRPPTRVPGILTGRN